MVCGRIPHKEGLDGGECPSGPTDATGETLVFHSSRKDCRSDTSSVRTKCDFFCFCISSWKGFSVSIVLSTTDSQRFRVLELLHTGWRDGLLSMVRLSLPKTRILSFRGLLLWVLILGTSKVHSGNLCLWVDSIVAVRVPFISVSVISVRGFLQDGIAGRFHGVRTSVPRTLLGYVGLSTCLCPVRLKVDCDGTRPLLVFRDGWEVRYEDWVPWGPRTGSVSIRPCPLVSTPTSRSADTLSFGHSSMSRQIMSWGTLEYKLKNLTQCIDL